ncbi:cubilin [Elysia marginata]|uniref:Cubilin n=1 Tax=Elysia marginata TaxID=1093978 RepID=A0AAV4G281_9GAST|nr:cubilin [Elysia marginata]
MTTIMMLAMTRTLKSQWLSSKSKDTIAMTLVAMTMMVVATPTMVVVATPMMTVVTIQVLDGNNRSANVLARRCGSSTPSVIRASGNSMLVYFHTDSSITRSGFRAHWYTIPECKQNLTGNEGSLQSPYYPDNYDNNMECVWTITADPGTQVTLTFSYLNLQTYSSASCRNDYLVVSNLEVKSLDINLPMG